MTIAQWKALQVESRKQCRQIAARARKCNVPGAKQHFAYEIRRLRRQVRDFANRRGEYTLLVAAFYNVHSQSQYAVTGLYRKFSGRAAYYA